MLAPPAAYPATSDVSPQDFLNPSKEGTRYTRPKAYHSVDNDGSRDVSPLDFLNPLQRGTPIGGGYV